MGYEMTQALWGAAVGATIFFAVRLLDGFFDKKEA